jgi:hypothetical protein
VPSDKELLVSGLSPGLPDAGIGPPGKNYVTATKMFACAEVMERITRRRASALSVADGYLLGCVESSWKLGDQGMTGLHVRGCSLVVWCRGAPACAPK